MQRLKRLADVGEQRALKFPQLVRVRGARRGIAIQHFPAQIVNGIPQRQQLRGQCGVAVLDLVQRRAEIAVERIQRAAEILDVDRLRIGRAELQRRNFLFDLPDELEFFGLVFREKGGHGLDAVATTVGSFSIFFCNATACARESAITAPKSTDLSAESISFCSNTTAGRPALCMCSRS